MRVLPPVGASASPYEVRRSRHLARSSSEKLAQFSTSDRNTHYLLRYLSEYLQISIMSERVLLTCDGKHALKMVFDLMKTIDKRECVALAAYTCPDVAVAAVSAGFKICLFDVDPESLLPIPASIADDELKECAAVVLSNLYGFPDDLDQWRALRSRYDFVIIDDACQALRSRRDGKVVGSCADTVGILSGGRGKALSGIGGGAVLFSAAKSRETSPQAGCTEQAWSRPDSSSLQARLSVALEERFATSNRRQELETGPVRYAKDILKSWLQWFFSKPAAFRLPASLPFLRLGETHCEMHLEETPLSEWVLLHMVTQLRLLSRSSIRLLTNSERWKSILTMDAIRHVYTERQPDLLGGKGPERAGRTRIVPLRYPVILDPKLRRESLIRLKQAGLGANESYPKPVAEFVALNSFIRPSECPGAAQLAESILTLPLHSSVLETDMTATKRIFEEIISC